MSQSDFTEPTITNNTVESSVSSDFNPFSRGSVLNDSTESSSLDHPVEDLNNIEPISSESHSMFQPLE